MLNSRPQGFTCLFFFCELPKSRSYTQVYSLSWVDFLMWYEQVSGFNHLHVNPQLIHHHLLKRLLLPFSCLDTHCKINLKVYYLNKTLKINKDLIMSPNFTLLISVSFLLPVWHCLDYHSFVLSYEKRKYEYFRNFVLFFKIILVILVLFISVWIWKGRILGKNCIEFVECFREKCHLYFFKQPDTLMFLAY